MQVSAIDHINIITDDLDGTAAFYEQVLGLTRGESPVAAATAGFKGAWLRDAAGNAIVHLVWKDPERAFGADHIPGQPTAALHHVAFRCQGFAAAQERLSALGLEFRVNDGIAGLRQIFVTDPNAINLELNFAGD